MVSRITGSVGKGLAAITMDKEYQQKRREEMNRPPRDFGESLAKGGKGFLKVAQQGDDFPTPLPLFLTGLHSPLLHYLLNVDSLLSQQGVVGGVTGIVTKPVEGRFQHLDIHHMHVQVEYCTNNIVVGTVVTWVRYATYTQHSFPYAKLTNTFKSLQNPV